MIRRTLTAVLIAVALSTVHAQAQSHAQVQSTGPNEAAVRTLFDRAWSAGDYSGLGQLLAPTMQFHYGGRSRPMSAEQFQGMVHMWRTAFPDLKFTIEDVVSSGDRVAARFTFTGTHQAQLMDLAPTGRTVSVDMMAFFRFADGRIVDMWETFNETGMRRQLTQ